MALFGKKTAPPGANGQPSIAEQRATLRDIVTGHSVMCDKNVATAAALLALGIDPNGIGKFGHLMGMVPDNQNVNIAVKSGSGWKWFAAICVVLGLLTVLLALSLRTWGWLAIAAPSEKVPPAQLPPQSAPVPTPAPIPAIVPPDGFIIQSQKQKDGSSRILWTLPAKQLPDGTAQSIDGRLWRQGPGDLWVEIK